MTYIIDIAKPKTWKIEIFLIESYGIYRIYAICRILFLVVLKMKLLKDIHWIFTFPNIFSCFQWSHQAYMTQMHNCYFLSNGGCWIPFLLQTIYFLFQDNCINIVILYQSNINVRMLIIANYLMIMKIINGIRWRWFFLRLPKMKQTQCFIFLGGLSLHLNHLIA